MTDKERILIAASFEIPNRVNKLSDSEFSVFSQWGDDGIIQFLIKHLRIDNDFFVEFGVENYRESNTRYLMMKNNWSGFVMDGSSKMVAEIVNSEYYWKYDLIAKQAFVSKENIMNLLNEHCPAEIGLLHIDIDGMDYWIWETISQKIKPTIVVLEYNSVFGVDRSITVPYNAKFVRHHAHHSGLYAGASLAALHNLSVDRGYAFVGTNSAGNNAYFVKKNLLSDAVKEVSLQEGYTFSKFRESRDHKGKLTYLRGKDRAKILEGLPMYNTLTQDIIPF